MTLAQQQDLEKIDRLMQMAEELLLPSHQDDWNIDHGGEKASEHMLEAKGDIVRCLRKMEKVKGTYVAAECR